MEEMLPAAKLLLSRRASLTFMQDNATAHGRGRLDGPVYNMVRKANGSGADLLDLLP